MIDNIVNWSDIIANVIILIYGLIIVPKLLMNCCDPKKHTDKIEPRPYSGTRS